MYFRLIDRVLDRSEDALVALKQVTAAEEYLRDHFATFPVLPGVMMIEALTQAARELLDDGSGERWVLCGVRALKYGHFVKPGEALRVEVKVVKRSEEGATLKAAGWRVAPGEEDVSAVSGRIELRRLRVWAGTGTS